VSAVGKRVGKSVGQRVGKRIGTPSGDAPGLLDFDGEGASFSRNNGTWGAGGTALQRSSINTWSDIAADILRTDTLGGVTLAGMFEKQVKNETSRSDSMASLGITGWTGVNNSTDVIDPLGTNTSAKFTTTTNAAHNVSQSYTVATIPNSTALVFSFWGRCATGTLPLRIRWRDNANTFVETPITLTTTWQRFSFAVNTGVGATASGWFIQNPAAGSVVADFYAIGAQLERGTYPMSRKITVAVGDTRWADVMTFASDEVPLAFRENAWTCTVRPEWASADLIATNKRVICSTDANNWVGFEYDAGSVYLRCYTGGTLRFGTGALTTSRNTDYPIICDLAAGVMTFNGVAGSAGTATTLPGGVALRVGGTAGGSNELDGALSEPRSV